MLDMRKKIKYSKKKENKLKKKSMTKEELLV